MMAGRSLRDLSSQNPFTGRKKEINIYREWLTGRDTPSVLFVHDTLEIEERGGIGKTSLLQAWIELTEKEYPHVTIVITDFFSPNDRNGITVAERVYRQLREKHPNWLEDAFLQALDHYRDRIRDWLAKNTPLDTQLKDDLQELQKELAQALYQDLAVLDRQLDQTYRNLVIFFDTFEHIEDNPSVAVLSPQQKFPEDYHFSHIGFVVAGRNEPDWEQENWKGRQQEVQHVPLRPFTPEEMIDYLDLRILTLDIFDPKAKGLHLRTKGRPILLGLVVDVLNEQIASLEDLLTISEDDFERYLVSKINNLQAPKPENWIVLFIAHAYHHFNASLLEWLSKEDPLRKLVAEIGIESGQKLLDTVSQLSFVRRSASGDEFVLHDEMRPLVNKYCWETLDPKKTFRNAVSRRVIAYYEDLLRREQSNLGNQIYRCEILYHKLFLDIDDGLTYFKERFDNAIMYWLHPYAHTLLQEVHQFEEGMSSDQRCTLWMQEARLLLRESRAREALDYYEVISRQAWGRAHQAEIFHHVGIGHRDIGNFPDAIEWLLKALKLAEEEKNQELHADILGTLGYIHRREGKLEDAASFYKQSIKIYETLKHHQSKYAEILNNLGNVCRLQGRVQDALTYCQTSLQVRERLFRNSGGSKVAIGLSHNTIGVIYLDMHNLAMAEKHLEESLNIFNEFNYKRGLSSVFCRQGEIALERHDYGKAMKLFQEAYDSAEKVDREVQANSLNKQGCTYLEQGDYTQARERLERAIELAEETGNVYQKAESLIDLILALQGLGEHEQSLLQLGRAHSIAREYRYYYLLGRVEMIWGEQLYQQQKYQEAFQHYGMSCCAMANYNHVEYDLALERLRNHLFDLAPHSAELRMVIDDLRDLWKRYWLEDKFPEFIQICGHVRSFIDVFQAE